MGSSALRGTDKKLLPLSGMINKDAMETDHKHIVREWNREIEEEIRRHDARQDDGPWKIIVWVVLEVLWFLALFGLFQRLQ